MTMRQPGGRKQRVSVKLQHSCAFGLDTAALLSQYKPCLWAAADPCPPA